MPEHALSREWKFVAPEIVFGPGCLARAGRFAANLGMERALLVTDPGVAAAGWAGKARDSLAQAGVAVEVFDQVTPNPRDHEVMRGAAFYRERGCDGIVAVGGGSPMDCAKGIGLVAESGRHVLEFEGVDRVDAPSPPLLCVPTTAGSSADVSQFAIILDTARGVKIAIVSKAVVPDVALVDPAATVTMDPGLTVNTGLDALTHAMEAYVSNAHQPLADHLALEAVRLAAANLERVRDCPGDLLARERMMLGSMYAGLAFSNAILGAVHAMAHALGGLLDLPHGLCNAILLDHVVAANFSSAPGRYMALGRAMGAAIPGDAPADEARELVVSALRGFKARLGAVVSLGELGVTRAHLPELARAAAADPCLATNPRSLGVSDIAAIYEQAL
ncbi:iron-containing alcohol dehydrogenase [Desulfovibrio sulfodismutans]|uniref:Iron-containing alcohol dehydrogenase n=1 Tax=Desulfolutivibrio sulfodismutans TaxID=63561 RepID=A0A7K3NK56_9BACT|nr:alcohol dehydrogenase-like regulatory protein ErcA [Desulfolutivibrio sulfodismutans]NDY56135.1 iron-containing alcohol dehydrogenase [Desulfolutivibrio sulfodismutans]QLA13187.1 iron-containing alcohol dehydrogenase [Desulfolutivibrio sulfodismutans DSM 3696]